MSIIDNIVHCELYNVSSYVLLNAMYMYVYVLHVYAACILLLVHTVIS